MYLGTDSKTVERSFTNKTRDVDKSVTFGWSQPLTAF